jgi:polar amino acid transport system substrate-binding protein
MTKAPFLLLLLALALPAVSQDAIVLAASELQPWKVYKGDRVEGVDLILMQRIAAEMRLRLEVVQAPLARCLSMLEGGEADLVTSVSPDAEREKYMIFLDTTYKGPNRKLFYLRKGSGVVIDRYEDLFRYVVGAKIGANYYEPFDSDPRIRKERVAEEEQNFKKLAAGRIDCLIANEPTGDYLIRALGLSGDIVKARYYEEKAQSGQIAIARRSPLAARAAEMNAILKRLVDSGEVGRMLESYIASVR